MKKLFWRRTAVWFQVVMLVGSLVFLALGAGQLYAANVYCKDVYPGECTQGGCDASSGWWGVSCSIRCSANLWIFCVYPPI